MAQANREKELNEFYALPEDLTAKLETEPETVLPNLFTKVHLAIEQAVLSQVGNLVGYHVQAQETVRQKEAQAKEMFFSAWPALKAQEAQVEPLAKQFGPMIAADPRFDTAEKRIQAVGRIVCATLGIPVPGETSAAPMTPAGGPATPPQPPQPPVAPRQPAGFRPATPGASGAGARPPQEQNEFAVIANSFLEDDEAP